MSKHYLAYDDNVRPRSTGNPGPADRDTKAAIKSGQGTADLNTDRATADYTSHKLRKEVADEIDVVRRSEFEDKIKGRPFDKRADGDSDNGTIYKYNAEQTTRSKLNTCYSSEGISNDCGNNSTREGTLNYDVCTASILGRYEEKNFGNTVPASGTYNASKEDRTITKDQICKVVNELESLTPDQKQKLSDILLKYQGSLTKKPGKCKNFEYTFQVEGQLPKSTYSRPIPFALRPTISGKSPNFVRFIAAKTIGNGQNCSLR